MKEEKVSLHAGAIEIDEAIQEYFPESDPLVVEKLAHWQNMKFGLLMHWAPCSQWGIVESWSLCSEDEGWCKRKMENYCEYKEQYENLPATFNPQKFDPTKWADAAAAAGMKYVVFTTKHHDGFCMFDTKYTDYKITGEACPFHSNPKANIARVIFDAFRKKEFMIGAYFSKPDWHSDYYWWQRFASPDRNPNYDIERYPERWQNFVDFTHNQIDELMSDYGDIDILWLDGGWVHAYSDEELAEARKKVTFNIPRVQNQDINMPLIAKNARRKQPGLIVVDRAVPGPQQNYLTPENQIPDEILPYPWETCMPGSSSWSHQDNAKYKSTRQLIHHLVDIVAKGGNFLLNIAPTPQGEFQHEAYKRLHEIGTWMQVNGEAIYKSKPVLLKTEKNICLTQLSNGTIFAIYLIQENERTAPQTLYLNNLSPASNAKIDLLGSNEKIAWKKQKNGCEISIPEAVRKNFQDRYAITLKITTD